MGVVTEMIYGGRDGDDLFGDMTEMIYRDVTG